MKCKFLMKEDKKKKKYKYLIAIVYVDKNKFVYYLSDKKFN